MYWKRILSAALAVVLLAGCGATGELPAGTPAPAAPGGGADVRFTPYASATPRPSSTPTPPGTATPLPSPSPTPRQHTVDRGQDMGGIAFLYGITLEELMAANPAVSPNSMSIGTVLLIPGGASPAAASTGIPSLTPVPLQAGTVNCAATREGGAWCFLPVTNTTGAALENLSAVVRLADDASGAIISQTALAPLDRLAPGETLPLTAYFPAPIPAEFHAGGELLTAMPVAGEGRYREVALVDTQIAIDPRGLSANAQGAVRLEDGETGAEQVWVAAVAYDASGAVAGVRRWEAGQPLPAGEQVAFDFAVYSTGAPIQRVELLVQARP